MMKKVEEIRQQYQMNQNVSPGKRKLMSLYNKGSAGTKELLEFEISGKVQKKKALVHIYLSLSLTGIYLSAQVMNCNKGSSVDIQRYLVNIFNFSRRPGTAWSSSANLF